MTYFFLIGKQAAGKTWRALAEQIGLTKLPTVSGTVDAGRALTAPIAANAVPAVLGAGAGYGTWHAAVPEDATATQKIEGGIAAGLAGVGASGFGRLNTWRNVLRKARAQRAEDIAKGLTPDLTKHFTNNALSDVVTPKLMFMGASLVPVGMSNVQSMVANARRATGNVAGMTDTGKELTDQLAAKDQSGKSVVEQLRDTFAKVTADAETASGTLAKGTQDITGAVTDATRNISGNLENASTAFADATKDVGGSLADASKSFAGTTSGLKDLTDTISPVMKDLAQKDESGRTVFGNVNKLLKTLNDYGNDLRQSTQSTVNGLNTLRQFSDNAQKYAPYVAGAGLTAGALYSLYRALKAAKKPANGAKRNNNADAME